MMVFLLPFPLEGEEAEAGSKAVVTLLTHPPPPPRHPLPFSKSMLMGRDRRREGEYSFPIGCAVVGGGPEVGLVIVDDGRPFL